MLRKTRLFCLVLPVTLTLLACNNGDDNDNDNGGSEPNPNPNPCDDIVCDEAPLPLCEGSTLVLFANVGECDQGECDYPEVERIECDIPPDPFCDGDYLVFSGEIGLCEEGECVYPESTLSPCDEPPPSYCDGNFEVLYYEQGQCVENECIYNARAPRDCEALSQICSTEEGRCVDLCEDVYCPPLDAWCEDGVLWMMVGHCDWQSAQCIYEEMETDLPDCSFGYNFDFEEWIEGYPVGFVGFHAGGLTISRDTEDPNSKESSLFIQTSLAEARNIRASMPFEHLSPGQVYTFHSWYKFQGRPADGTTAHIRPIIEIANEAGDVEADWVVAGPYITLPTDEWTEITITTPPMTEDRAYLRPLIEIRGEEGHTIWVNLDDWAVTMPITRNLNSRRDLDSVLFLFNGAYWVSSGIDNRGILYPSARSAETDEGWDQLLFAWIGEPCQSLVPAPWEKSGQVAGPTNDGVLLALMQDPSGYCEWQRFDPASESWNIIMEHRDCSDRVGDHTGLNYSLEGVLDLVAHLEEVDNPAQVPKWFSFASSHWTTGSNGTLIYETQAPASRDQDGNINANETFKAHRATFLSGKVSYYYPSF